MKHKKTRIIVIVVLCLAGILLYICRFGFPATDKGFPTIDKLPIFETGVYDGYQYLPEKWGGNSNIAYATQESPAPTYKHLLGIRNEENECSFDSIDDVYVNASLGFYKEKNCKTSPFYDMPVSSLDIKLYVINHISDATNYEENRGQPTKEFFSGLVPLKEISDYYDPQTDALNPIYGCFENEAKGGKYIDYEHHVRLVVPSDVFYFDDGYITVVAVFYPQYSENENIGPTDMILSAKISYEKRDGKIILLNYKEITDPVFNYSKHSQSSETDALGYVGGNLYIDMGNAKAAKIDGTYFAKYTVSPTAGFSFRRYLIKIGGIVYYKDNIHQTYWTKLEDCDTLVPFYGLNSPSGYIDPEDMFAYMSSFRAPEHILTLQREYGVVLGEEQKNDYDNLTLLMRYTADRNFYVSYYADGWIKRVWGMGEQYDGIPNLDLDYYVDADWETTQINPLHIMEKPVT